MTLKYPEDLVVGFQDREDSMIGRLAYVTYMEKNKLRKEKSFNGWRSNDIELLKIKNEPKDGFLISKSVRRDSYHFGSGRSMIRLFDPDGFDFEISVSNMEYILINCDLNKGEIKGKFVYTWSGAELQLIPVDSDLYRSAVLQKKNEAQKIKASDLQVGAIYVDKKYEGVHYTYLGRHDFYKEINQSEVKKILKKELDTETLPWSVSTYRQWDTPQHNQTPKKQHVFYSHDNSIFVANATSKLGSILNEEDDTYPDLLESFKNSSFGRGIKEVDFKTIQKKDIQELNKEIIKKAEWHKTSSSIFDSYDNKWYLSVSDKYFIKIGVNHRDKGFSLYPNGVYMIDKEGKALRKNQSITDCLSDIRHTHGFTSQTKESLFDAFCRHTYQIDKLFNLSFESKYIKNMRNMKSTSEKIDINRLEIVGATRNAMGIVSCNSLLDLYIMSFIDKDLLKEKDFEQKWTQDEMLTILENMPLKVLDLKY